MSKDGNDFKVIDRRGSAGGEGGGVKPPEKKGETFTMKDSDAAQAAPSQIDFSTLTLSLATSALINLGIAPDPVTQKVSKNIETAKQNIEILNLLKVKTKGNLTPDEDQLLENLLTEVRLRFVEASK